jgi:hypothetical protein
VTAQLECLLDDVVVGKQEMVGAIDAVCDVAQRIIGKLMILEQLDRININQSSLFPEIERAASYILSKLTPIA